MRRVRSSSVLGCILGVGGRQDASTAGEDAVLHQFDHDTQRPLVACYGGQGQGVELAKASSSSSVGLSAPPEMFRFKAQRDGPTDGPPHHLPRPVIAFATATISFDAGGS
jgi:hypothetical protein